MKKLLKILLVVGVLGAIGYVVLGTLDLNNEQLQYRTVPVTRGSIADVVTANGTLNPMDLVTVGTQVSGQVNKIYVKMNEEVKKGQLLAEIDPALLLTELKQAKTAMETARLAYEQSERDLERTRTLVSKDYLPKVDLERAEQAYFSAKNSYESAQSIVERSEVNLNYTKIYSPIDGVIISQEVTLGQTVQASYQTPNLFKIAGDMSKMKIDVNFSESDISKVKTDMPITFTVDAFPDEVFQGKIDVINMNSRSEQGVVTYSVTVSVDNSQKKLLPGMTAYISLTVSEIKDVLRITPVALRFTPPAPKETNALRALFQPNLRSAYKKPVQTPLRDQLKRTIYVLKNNVATPVEIIIGPSDDMNVNIGGPNIQEGDEVIIGLSRTGSR